MRDMLKTQEGMDLHLEQRDEELCQLQSQSQVNGAQLAALSLQMQELISSVESRAEVVGKDLEEINRWFDHYRGEINRLKIREKDTKEETEQLKGFIVGAGHEAQVFKNRLDRIEENVCRCGRTPLEVGEEFISSEDEGRTELSYASVREDEYVAPLVENLIPLPIPAPAPCCQGSHSTLPPMEEITEEPAFICEDLDSLLREVDEGRTELSYASVRKDEYVAPPVENSIPLPIPAPAPCCQGSHTTLPPMEEITEEPSFICKDLDGLLREADKGRARDLQEGSSNSVVRLPPRVGSEEWRRLNGIH